MRVDRFSGPPGSRSRPLEIKNPGQIVAAGSFSLHQLPKWLVQATTARAPEMSLNEVRRSRHRCWDRRYRYSMVKCQTRGPRNRFIRLGIYPPKPNALRLATLALAPAS